MVEKDYYIKDVNPKIIEYLKDLDKKLKERHTQSFWALPDNIIFKVFKDYTKTDWQKRLKENYTRYKNKHLARISINITTSKSTWYKSTGILLQISIDIFKIHDNGTINTKFGDSWGALIAFKENDFKISKFSIKLVLTGFHPNFSNFSLDV